MTAPDNPTLPRSEGLESEEQLRARVRELERELAKAQSMHTAEARIGSTALITLGVGLLVTTPLALATLKRCVDWWRR